MYCRKCGNENDGAAVRCSNCGTALQEAEKKPNTKKLLPILIAGVAVITVIVVLILLLSRPKAIHLNDYMKVTFTGMNTAGHAEVEFDEEQLAVDLMEAYPDVKEKTSPNHMTGGVLSDLSRAIEFSLDKDSDLTNGDSVVLSIEIQESFCEYYDIQLTCEGQTFVVEGLPDGTVIDVFADFLIFYSGISPNAEIESFKNTSDDEFLQSVHYTVSKTRGLAIGDSFTVEAEFRKENAEDHLYIVEQTKKEYTVPELSKYVTSFSQMPEEVYQKLLTEADEVAQKYFLNQYVEHGFGTIPTVYQYGSFLGSLDEAESVTNMKLDSAYFLEYKQQDDGSFHFGEQAYEYLIFKYTFSVNDYYGENYPQAYAYVYYKNLVVDTDGTVNSAELEAEHSADFFLNSDGYDSFFTKYYSEPEWIISDIRK